MERLLRRLAASIYRHPRWYAYPQLVLFAASLVYASAYLDVRSSRSDLVTADLEYEKRWRSYKLEFPAQDDVVILIESEDLEKNRQFVERLAARIESDPSLFRNVLYRGDLQQFGRKALLLLPEERIAHIARPLEEYAPLVDTFSEVTNLPSLFSTINHRLRSVKPEEASDAPLARALTPLTRILHRAADSLERSGVPPSPGWSSLFAETAEGQSQEYIALARGRIYLVACEPVDVAQEGVAIATLREWVRETSMEVPGVNAGVTGESVLRRDEVEQATHDTAVASVLSLAAVLLIFIYGYHEIARPLKATITLIVGIGYTLGFATLSVGHLNILTLTFVPILIGLAIDFGVHLVTRFEEELRLGRGKQVALSQAIVFAGTGVFISGLTTAGAFLAMTLTSFKGVREMGIISGGGLLLCLIPMFTLLPSLLLAGRNEIPPPPPRQRRKPRIPGARRMRWDQFWLNRPRRVIAVGALLTAVSIWLLPGIRFDYNLLNLQSPNLPAVIFEKKLIEASPKSLLHCVVLVDSAEEAVRMEARLRALKTVATVDSVGRLLTEDPSRKLAWVRRIQAAVEPIVLAPFDSRPVDLAEFRTSLQKLASFVSLASGALRQRGEAELATQLRALADAGFHLERGINALPAEEAVVKLTDFQQAFFRDLAGTLDALKHQEAREGVRVQDLPPVLRNRFIGRTGRFVLRVYPKDNVWEREVQEEFVRELRSIVPDVTGSPVRFYESTTLLKGGFQQAALYATASIALMLLLHFKRVTGTLLALMPVLLGLIWMGGLMSLLDIPFNPANLTSITLIIGIGVTNGIHILTRFREEKHPSILAKSTGKAVVVSALTTMAGFGSLMLAQHRGIASLGVIMVLGTVLCMLAALTVLPSVLILLCRRKPGCRNQLD